ncbi:hypothetical protein [Nocardia sp. NPDC049149]
MSVATEIIDPYLFERVQLVEDAGTTADRIMGVLPCGRCGGSCRCYA